MAGEAGERDIDEAEAPEREAEQPDAARWLGLDWNGKPEAIVDECRRAVAVLGEVEERAVLLGGTDATNYLIEGDNLAALLALCGTHSQAFDLIYIDPPYNTGKKDFIYNDRYVDEEDSFRHSKWLSFMERRLVLARELLSEVGVIVVHIDEHEVDNLYLLLTQVFGPQNDLGRIIWNKRNPKGDSKGVAIQHESVLCFARSKEKLLAQEGVLRRRKPHAEAMLSKARSLFKQVGKRVIPPDVKDAIAPFGYSKEQLKDFEVEYTLEMANKEFAEWLKRQDFSEGEKAYKNINDEGRLWQSVSLQKPKDPMYFEPLTHPVTGKPCVVPPKGWRRPPAGMNELLEQSRILFGPDETTQPRRIYYLDENMDENTPSIFDYGASDERFFEDLGVTFDHPKPVAVAKYLLSSIINRKDAVVLDFFAGSGTVAHAVLELNAEDGGSRRFILVTNNENGIAEEVCYPRVRSVIEGFGDGRRTKAGIPANLRCYRVGFVSRFKPDGSQKCLDQLRADVEAASRDTVAFAEDAHVSVLDHEDYVLLTTASRDRFVGLIHEPGLISSFEDAVERVAPDAPLTLHVFSYGGEATRADFAKTSSRLDALTNTPDSYIATQARLLEELDLRRPS